MKVSSFLFFIFGPMIYTLTTNKKSPKIIKEKKEIEETVTRFMT